MFLKGPGMFNKVITGCVNYQYWTFKDDTDVFT